MESEIDSPKRVPPAVWLGLTLAVLLDTPVQLIWKALMAHQAAMAGPLVQQAQALLSQPLFWVLLLLFAVQFLNWMWVLGEADLSYAQPFTALSYLTVSTGAAWIFREHLSIGRVSGIVLILGGVLLRGINASSDDGNRMTGSDRIIGITAILLSTGAEAVGQLAFKRGAIDSANRVRAILLGFGAFAIDAVLWSVALYYLDVTVAHPIGSLVFVEVAILSRWRLGERLSRRRWAGVLLILAGSAIVAVT